jgi:hypothetical protein
VSKSRDIIFDIFPYEYTVALGGSLLMRGGIGLSIVKSALEEKGYFITSPLNPFHPSVLETATTNHVFNNSSDTTFYTGKFQIELKIKTFDDNFIIRNRTEYIPFYYLHHSQKMNISPLISNSPFSHDYSGASSPYLMNEIKIHVFKLLEFQYQIEYQKLKFEQIGINYNAGSWIFVAGDENTYTIHNHSFTLNLRPDIFKEVDPLVGLGKKWFRTKNTTTGESLVRENEWIFNIGFTSRKF